MTVIVRLSSNNFNQNNSPRCDSYWTGRREWWRANKAKLGTDWDTINRLQVEVAAFLADVKRRRAE